MTQKESLLWIVDDFRYARKHCYQFQLGETLRKNFRVRCVSLRELKMFGGFSILPAWCYDNVLCSVRIRVLRDVVDKIAPMLSHKKIWVYDEDPWESFIDESALSGSYEKIKDGFARQFVSVAGFIVQSTWWAEFIRARGFPAKAFQIGLLPRLCTTGRVWDKRSIPAGFQGSPKPHRISFFAELEEDGIFVEQFKCSSYHHYLKQLQNTQVFIHPETKPFIVNGKSVVSNGMWGRDVEVAAQGAFVLRNEEPEGFIYGISEIPTIRTFKSIEEVPRILSEIIEMDPNEREFMREKAVSYIRQRDYWHSVVDIIKVPDFYRD